jgi:hypothetical protein
MSSAMASHRVETIGNMIDGERQQTIRARERVKKKRTLFIFPLASKTAAHDIGQIASWVSKKKNVARRKPKLGANGVAT